MEVFGARRATDGEMELDRGLGSGVEGEGEEGNLLDCGPRKRRGPLATTATEEEEEEHELAFGFMVLLLWSHGGPVCNGERE